MTAGVCIGCGEALFPDRVAVEGLDLCRACLTPRAVPPKPRLGEHYPPIWWGLMIGGALLGVLILGGALGFAVNVGLSAIGLGLSGYGIAWGAAFGVAVFAVRLRRTTELLDRRWKRETAARLGLAHLPLGRFAFAVLLLDRKDPGPEDVGLLAETDDAVVFLGRHGGMTVIPLSSVFRITADGFCGAWWACLRLGDRSCRWVQIKEQGEMAWGRVAATAAFADRVDTKLNRSELRIPRWEEEIGRQAEALAGLSAATTPERLDELWKLAKGMPPPDANPTRDELDEGARQLVAVALSLLLVDRGWAFASDLDQESLPTRDSSGLDPDPNLFVLAYGSWPFASDGRRMTLLTKEGIELDPFDVLEKLAKKEVSTEEWRETWTRAGVAEVDLGEFAASKCKATRSSEDRSGSGT